jgi:ketosteroid isomerase-like protein
MCLALACAPAAFAADPTPGLTAAECEVFDRELSFAESVDKHDKKLFAEHLHESAVFGAASPSPQRGRDAILKAWDGIVQGKNVKLEWRPQFVSLGTDTIAISRGPFAFTSKNEKGETKYSVGTFVSVWTRKDKSSPWYVVLDGGGPPPTPATAEEVKKHMATAPAVCPRADTANS